MGAITGSDAKAGLKVATTFGTPTAIGANDQLDGYQITVNENAAALKVLPLGSGDGMLGTTDRGAVAPTVNINGPLGYNNAALVGIAELFGGASVMGMGSSTYMHSILFNEVNTNKFCTIAFQAHSATTASVEIASAVATKLTLTADNVISYYNLNMDFLGDELDIASATNTYATLESATSANTRRVIFDLSDAFWINAQAGGALSSGDKKNVKSVVVEYTRAMEHPGEAKGSSGNGVPISSGEYPWDVKLTVTFRSLEDFTFITAQQAGTEYKASFTATSTQLVGGANYYTFQQNFPRLKIVESPDLGLVETGNNPLTVVFQAMVASTAPTGMISRFPYLRVQNDRSTALLA